jgi:hypothetical protein
MPYGQPIYFQVANREYEVFEKVRTVTAALTLPDVSNPGYQCVGYPQIVMRWGYDGSNSTVLEEDIDALQRALMEWLATYPGISNVTGETVTINTVPVTPPVPPEAPPE